ncbi:MAG TPA: ThiF family adenylyltransferase [Pyrinomonadaceae bacterium]
MNRRKREKEKLKQQIARQAQPLQQPARPALDHGFYNASVVTVPDFKLAQIVLVGCGGIGAYMAQHIGRIMRVLYSDEKGINLTLCDPDIVEEKNLGRQLFCDAEIGQPKAVALARRYGQAWALNTTAYHGEYREELLLGTAELIVLVGCVDNAAARRVLADTLMNNPQNPGPHAPPKIWWLDCGNLKDTGRTMLGSASSEEQMRGAFLDGKKCISLPSPTLQYPSLLIPQPEELDGAEMSCAEMAAANLQSLNINAAVAVQAADMLTRLLVTRDLKRYQCAVNVAAGSVKSFYCTPEQVAEEIERPVSFVDGTQAHDVAA